MQISKYPSFRQGLVDGAVFIPVLAPFSMLFGVFAAEAGLSLIETMGYGLFVFAGAAQILTMSLIEEQAPIFIAVLAGFTLNLRMVLYSATLAPHFRGLAIWKRVFAAYILVDQNFVLADNQYQRHAHWSGREKWLYFVGAIALIGLPWHFFTWLGFVGGNLIPAQFDIAFALPLSFLALILPAIKTRPQWLAATIAAIGALILRDLPYNFGMMIAALIGIIVAAELERRSWKGGKIDG